MSLKSPSQITILMEETLWWRVHLCGLKTSRDFLPAVHVATNSGMQMHSITTVHDVDTMLKFFIIKLFAGE